MTTYIPDADRLSEPMGQYMEWCGKLFFYHGEHLGWVYVKGLT